MSNLPANYYDREKPIRVRDVKPKKFKQYPDVKLHQRQELELRRKKGELKGFAKQKDFLTQDEMDDEVFFPTERLYRRKKTEGDTTSISHDMVDDADYVKHRKALHKRHYGSSNYKKYKVPTTPPVTQSSSSSSKSPFYRDKPMENKKRKRSPSIKVGYKKKQKRS